MPQSLPPRRTQAERTQQRREQLIREAQRFFAQHGFHGAKLADIARAAGVTEPGLLHHFPSKTHLLMDVLAERDRADRERFAAGQAGALESMRRLVAYNQTVPGLVQLFTVLVGESVDEQHPGHDFFKRRYQGLRERTEAMVRAAQERGELRADVPAGDLVILLFAVMDGLQIQWLYEPQSVDMARSFEQFLHLLGGYRENSDEPHE